MQTESTAIDGTLTVEEAFARVLKNDLAVLQEWAPVALRGDDIAGVHKMRVRLRRMRSALTVFRSAIGKKATTYFSNEMRRAAKALDRARELDVYITENLTEKGNKRQKRLRKIAEKQRREAYAQVGEFITGQRYTALCNELNEWIEAKAWRRKSSAKRQDRLQENITVFASRVLDEHRSKILNYGNDIVQLDNETLHELRLECKKLRYATEFFTPLYGKQMKFFTGRLKNLQNLLGSIQDTVVMTGLQKDLLRHKKNKKSNGSKKLSRYSQKLERQRQKEAQMAIAELSHRWQEFSEVERPWIRTAEVAA